MTPAANTPGVPARHRHLMAGLAGCAALLTGLAGCTLRAETPPPPTPIPDLVEVVRESTAEDAVELADLATRAAAEATGQVATLLTQVASDAEAHLAAVGGVYQPFPGVTPEPSPTPTESPVPPPAPDPAAVLDRLVLAASTARDDADAVPDGSMARLLASVAANRLLLGEALAASLAGTAVSAPTETEPVPETEQSTETDPVAEPEQPDLPDPTQLPSGLTTPDVLALVQSEDAAGMVWEVAAARSADAVRQQAADRAAAHRHRAQAWAGLAGVAGTADDPRRSAYDLPDAVTDDAATPEEMWSAVHEVEAALAQSYTSLVASAEPGARGALIDAAVDCLRQVLAGGADVPAFPGMPERA